jgi:hypothetical protein
MLSKGTGFWPRTPGTAPLMGRLSSGLTFRYTITSAQWSWRVWYAHYLYADSSHGTSLIINSTSAGLSYHDAFPASNVRFRGRKAYLRVALHESAPSICQRNSAQFHATRPRFSIPPKSQRWLVIHESVDCTMQDACTLARLLKIQLNHHLQGLLIRGLSSKFQVSVHVHVQQ